MNMRSWSAVVEMGEGVVAVCGGRLKMAFDSNIWNRKYSECKGKNSQEQILYFNNYMM